MTTSVPGSQGPNTAPSGADSRLEQAALVQAPLVVDRLGHRYRPGRPWAIRDVSLAFPVGSITALIGPNGAGKSTLIRACLGFESPAAGSVRVLGIDPSVDRAAALRAIGYIPQATSLHRRLTIADHLTLASAARSSFDVAHAMSRIAHAKLTPDRRIGELSGGEQAQVALALALGTRTPLLLLDEPLASLDPLSRRDFLGALLNDVRGREATVVLSSHIIGDVEHVCDRLVVLGGGRVVLEAEVQTALRRFRVVAEGESDGIAAFAGPSGQRLTLVENRPIGREASLEEIVLAHLSLARDPRQEAA